MSNGKTRAAPEFTLPDVNGNPITLSRVLDEGHMAMVIFFAALGLTGLC